MDLPRDPFEHIRKIMEQYSAAERAMQQAQAMTLFSNLGRAWGRLRLTQFTIDAVQP